MHTSTVTVAVLDVPSEETLKIPDSEIDWHATRGSGPGGQNRNKTSTCVMMTHRPTGISVRCETERSQSQNRALARQLLLAKLKERRDADEASKRDSIRSNQVGSGMRGDKRRTYREKDDSVVDHVTQKKASLKRVMRGEIELLA